MTRSANFSSAGKDYASEALPLSKLSAFIMGRFVEPTREVVKSIGQTLKSGCTRALQFASNTAVTTGEYVQQKAYAFANIAEQVCKQPKPSPG